MKQATNILTKRRYFTALFCYFFIAWSAINAQSIPEKEDFIANIQYFNTSDGLSHRTVYHTAKDQRGIIWVGTRNGLNRFDGQYFKGFNSKDGLAQNNINRIYSDGEVLWCIHYEEVSSHFKSFSLFHSVEEKVLTFEEYFGQQNLFKKEHISDIFILEDRLFIKVTLEGKNTIYSIKDNTFHLIKHVSETEDLLYYSDHDDYWVCNRNNDFIVLEKYNQSFQKLRHVETDFESNRIHLNSIYEDNKETLWLRMEGERTGIASVSATDEISIDEETVHLIGNNKLVHLYTPWYQRHEKYDAFWYVHGSDCALLRLDGTALYVGEPRIQFLSSAAFIDGELIWQPSDDGLYLIELKKNTFKTFYKGKNQTGFRGITSVKDEVYLNSYEGVFKIKKNETENFQKIYPFGLSSLKSRDNQLWLSYFYELRRFNPINQSTEIFSVPAHEVWSLYEDDNGLIWYSMLGLSFLNPQTKEVKEVNYNSYTTLKEATVYHFYKREDGIVLLCTTNGIYELDIEKGIIGRYWSEGKGKYHIPANDFRHLYFDKSDGSFWLATNEEGLLNWNPRTSETEIHSLRHLEANITHAVYPDDFGYLWLSTENGIVQFNKKSGVFKSHLPRDGTSSHEFNRISHYQDEDGTIYFGSIDGVTIFHPKDFTKLSLEETKVQVVEVNQFIAKDNTIKNKTEFYNKNNKVFLRPRDRFFNLRLTLDKYVYSSSAIYYHKLKRDKAWAISNDNQLEISNLPYGKQILEVKALLDNGQFSETLEIPVTVRKPFYLTIGFVLLIIFLGIGTTYFIIRWRTKQLNAQNMRLEQEVEKRTATIAAQAKELKELDKNKSKFFANISHELRTPITLIQGPIQSVLNKKNINNRDFTLLSKADQNTNNLLSLVNEILDLTKLESSKLELEETKVVFYTFLKRIISNFQSIADKKKIAFIFEYNLREDLQVQLDKGKFEKIINNLLSNAFKFTPKNGEINISVQQQNNRIQLKVKDNGRGIPSEDLPNIFNRYYQSSTNTKAEGGLGIGLALSMEFAKLMKGNLWAESEVTGENQGTTFFFEFPKKEVIAMIPTEEALAIKTTSKNDDLRSLIDEESRTTTTIKTPNQTATILLVEDNYDLREYVQFLLEPHYQVITAENGKEALEQLTGNIELPTASAAATHCQLIISDVMMPIMDGFEFLEKVKENEQWSNIPFVMLTARAELKDKLKALRIGVDDYLVKPFKEEELLVRIENLLANYEERKAFINSQEEKELPAQEVPAEPKIVIKQEDKIWLERVEVLVEKEMNNSIFSVDYLAELLNISRRALYRKIKMLTGLTPNQYIRIIRLQLAKDMLENGTHSTVKSVALAVGFQKIEYFSSLYKKQFGKSPSEYIK